jgi:hypothetical protein
MKYMRVEPPVCGPPVSELHVGEKHRAANWGRASTCVAGSTVTCRRLAYYTHARRMLPHSVENSIARLAFGCADRFHPRFLLTKSLIGGVVWVTCPFCAAKTRLNG